jgi:hypothetical protein
MQTALHFIGGLDIDWTWKLKRFLIANHSPGWEPRQKQLTWALYLLSTVPMPYCSSPGICAPGILSHFNVPQVLSHDDITRLRLHACQIVLAILTQNLACTVCLCLVANICRQQMETASSHLAILKQWHQSVSYRAASLLAIIVPVHETVSDAVLLKWLCCASIAWIIPNQQSLPSEQTHGSWSP